MTATKAFDYLVRIAGVLALVLGLALWTGRLYGLVGVHKALGAAVVLGLWGLAVLALRRRGRSGAGLAVLALVWGAATLALGGAQTGLLVGDLHWVVKVLHLALGLGAIALAAVLARSLREGAAAPQSRAD